MNDGSSSPDAPTDAERGPAGALPRTARLYPWYAAAMNVYAWVPVFVLYFLEHLTMREVLRLEAVYYLCVFALEVPSGYFSDRVGRRPTLVIATGALVAAYAVFASVAWAEQAGAAPFAVLAAGQVLLAVGLAFNSGTDTSLHYDTLKAAGCADRYAAREALVSRNTFLAGALGGLLGGALGVIDLRLAYVVSAGCSVAAFVLVLCMREPASHERRQCAAPVVEQLRTCAGALRSPVLAWVFAFYVVATVLNHVPYEYYQAYLKQALGAGGVTEGWPAPLVSGLHVVAVMLVASWFAGRSVALRDRFGLAGVLLLAAGLQTALIAAMAAVVSPVVVVLLVMRSVPRALAAAPINAAVSPRVGTGQRATYLSVQSLAGRLAFGGALLGLSLVPGEAGEHGGLSAQLWAAAGVGVAGCVGLWATRRAAAG